VNAKLASMNDGDGGDDACWLDQVCDECGGIREEGRPHECRQAVAGPGVSAGDGFVGRFGLTGKVVLLIGGGGEGGQGMGPAIATAVASLGADVAVVDRDVDRAEVVAGRVRAAGRRSVAIAADVTETAQIADVVQRTVGEFGGVDVLVNVVGIAQMAATLDYPESLWDEQFAVNVKYVFFACQAAAKAMIEQGRGGCIVNLASISGVGNSPGHVAYGAAKAGLMNLTRSLAVEWAEHGIRVNAVAPGATATPRIAGWYDANPELAESFYAAVPLGRIGQTDDIANAVVFMASDLSAYVTGQTLVVDGGLTLTTATRSPAKR
jgi:NAD(P)-dependent dehydrogenase (short-subunit alcohol dehydrogenase family)